jgi:hypothetical protein
MSFFSNNSLLLASKKWDPSRLNNIALWLDADSIDRSSIKLSQWSDKSFNNRHAIQNTENSQPSYFTFWLNNRPSVRFDGSDDIMEGTSNLAGLLQNVSGSTFFVVMTIQTGTSKVPFSISTGTSAVSSRLYLRHNISGFNRVLSIGGRRLDTDFFQENISTITLPISTIPIVYGSVIDYSTATLIHSINGISQEPVGFLTPGNTSNSAPLRYLVGNNTNLAAYFHGGISELLVFNQTLNTNDRQKLEGYLAHKWGLASNLPVGHLYKSSAPT